jgi:hypothetical protein
MDWLKSLTTEELNMFIFWIVWPVCTFGLLVWNCYLIVRLSKLKQQIKTLFKSSAVAVTYLNKISKSKENTPKKPTKSKRTKSSTR